MGSESGFWTALFSAKWSFPSSILGGIWRCFGAGTQNTNEGSLDLRNSGIRTKLEMKCTGT